MRAAVALCLALLLAMPAWAQRASVHIGDHRDFGRVVISLGSANPATVRRHGTRIDVAVPENDDVVSPKNVPRNVVAMVGSRGSARLTIVAGAHVKSSQDGRMLVIDVLDPGKRSRKAALTTRSRPNPGEPAVAPPVLEAAVKPVTTETASAPAVSETPTQQQSPAPAPDPSHETAGAPVQAVEDVRPAVRSFAVGASAATGAAAFRLGSLGVVIFDDEVTPAEGDGGEPILMPTVEAIHRGTLMTVPLADNEALAVTRSEDALIVSISAPTGSAAVTTTVPTGIRFQVTKPGRVMAVSDPISGQTMLIGTTRQATGDHARVDIGRSAPGYVLLPTWLGVAVMASSDQIDLTALPSGYGLVIADKAATNATAAASQENQFNIPNAPPDVLLWRLNAQIAGASAAPPRRRGLDRVAAARTMLALGMSSESAALLTLAASDDPTIARDPSTAALTGIAAILAGRPAEATGLDNPAIPTGGDMALWRGLRDAADGKSAPALAGAWPLLSAYPEAIRQRIAPPIMEAAALNGADVPAADMAGPTLALARALKLSHDGQTGAAISALTEVKNGRDERASVQAAVALAELQLRTGGSSPAETAEQLERQTIRWRGDNLELSLQLRVAELRSKSGRWRAALEGLRRSQAVFPEKKTQIAAAQSEVLSSLLATGGSTVSPLEMVLIADEFADDLPGGESGDRMAALLSDKLAALDLPTRAIAVLESLIAKSRSPAARAEYGLRLAQIQIEAGDGLAAERVLSSLDISGLPASREEQRTMLISQAKAGQGDFAGAATVLLTLSTPEADEMRASYYARAGYWQRSLETLDGIVSASIPEKGDLTERQQHLVLREATAAVQAGNTDALKKLSRFDSRLRPPRADLFHVLTASAVNGPEDLPRAARELAVSRAIPARLNALESH